MKKVIQTQDAPFSPGLLSQAIEVDGLVFTSGQIHIDNEFQLVGDTIEEKTRKVMDNLKAVLTAVDLGFDDVIKVTVYLIDMKEYSNFTEVYVTFFNKPMPAREVVCVKELPMGASVEVSLIAKKS